MVQVIDVIFTEKWSSNKYRKGAHVAEVMVTNDGVLCVWKEAGDGQEATDEKDEVTTTRIVYQYHFTAWPDKWVPKDPGPVLNFLDDINDKQEKIEDTAPIVVHCRSLSHRSFQHQWHRTFIYRCMYKYSSFTAHQSHSKSERSLWSLPKIATKDGGTLLSNHATGRLTNHSILTVINNCSSVTKHIVMCLSLNHISVHRLGRSEWDGILQYRTVWNLIMVALCNRADHYIFTLWFLLLSFFFFLA